MYKKYLPALAKAGIKISFLDETNKDTLENCIATRIILQSKNRDRLDEAFKKGVINKDNFDQNILKDFNTLRQLVIEDVKGESGLEINNSDFFPVFEEAIKNRTLKSFLENKEFFSKDDISSVYHKLVEFSAKDYNDSYNQLIKDFQDNPSIQYEFIDKEDIDAVTFSDISQRYAFMVDNIIKYIKTFRNQELIIVSVGANHVNPMVELLQNKGLKEVLGVNGASSPTLESVEAYIDNILPRPIEEQQKDETRFKLALASVIMEIDRKEEIQLGDEMFIRESFQLSSDIKEAVKQRDTLKAIEGIKFTYNSQQKAFDITCSTDKIQEIRNIFVKQPVEEVKEEQSFKDLVEKQNNQYSSQRHQ